MIRHSLLITCLFFPCWIGAQCSLQVSLGEDLQVCSEDKDVRLNAEIEGEYLHFTWSPAEMLDNPFSLSPGVVFDGTVSEQFSIEVQGFHPIDNLLANPSFEEGETGFTSEYESASTKSGGYLISTLGTDLFEEAKPCSDRTSGFGQMLMAKISDDQDLSIWCQEIAVKPNTDYHFRGYATGLRTNLPPVLVLKINGEIVSSGTLGSFACSWQEINGDWKSGPDGVANICIHVSPEDIGKSTDFAIDDLGFYEVCSKQSDVAFESTNFRVWAPEEIDLPCNGNLRLSVESESPGGDVSFRWITEGGNFTTDVFQPTVDINRPGLYGVVGRWTRGDLFCFDSTRMYVTSTLDQEFELVQSRTGSCEMPTANLRPLSEIPDTISYSWETKDGEIDSDPTSRDVTALSSGTYTLTLANPAKTCTISKDIVVNFEPLQKVSYELDPIDCVSGTRNLLFLADDGEAQFSIDDGSTFSPSPEFFALGEGEYILQVRDGSNCTSTDTLILDAFKAVKVSVDSLVENDQFQLVPDLNIDEKFLQSIDWSPASLVSCDTCLQPFLTSGASGLIQVRVVDMNGCLDTSTIRVGRENFTLLFMPNAFSPNGDGVNDVLTTGWHPSIQEVESWQIFNRNGAMIFERNNFKPGAETWDGQIDGVPLSVGTFISVLRYRSNGILRDHISTVSLLK